MKIESVVYLNIMSKYFLLEFLEYYKIMCDNISYIVMMAYLSNIFYESTKYLCYVYDLHFNCEILSLT
jgi:hypothetical protein